MVEQQIPKLRLALLVQANDLAVQHGVCIRYGGSNIPRKVGERRERVAIAGNQLRMAILDDGQCPKAVAYFSSKSHAGSSNGNGHVWSGMGWKSKDIGFPEYHQKP
jgi:hypothetical protein